METTVKELMNNAISIAKTLFDRGKSTGSTGNLSFKYRNHIYITSSGVSFGLLNMKDFTKLTLDGSIIDGPKPSKEYPLHLMMYNKNDKITAVIHTHGFYSTLWSCLEHPDWDNCIPTYTPYLNLKIGPVKLIPYHDPGSDELFNCFNEKIDYRLGYLLKNHGPIVAGKSLYEAFYELEEFEESCRLAWYLRNEKADKI